ncbi:hypothetical protein MIC448_420035 [Microbacterium sp. C448]|nr:hypothetical protein MIC448_420035 [Microbacterium sp. C448]
MVGAPVRMLRCRPSGQANRAHATVQRLDSRDIRSHPSDRSIPDAAGQWRRAHRDTHALAPRMERGRRGVHTCAVFIRRWCNRGR